MFPEGLTKVNVDTALSKNTVLVARLRLPMTRKAISWEPMLEGISDAETMKTIACREGLALASNLDLRRLCVACDSANTVRNVKGKGMGIYGPIVQEITSRTRSLAKVEYVREGHQSNVDMHILAPSALVKSLDRHVWFVTPPDGLCNSYVDQ